MQLCSTDSGEPGVGVIGCNPCAVYGVCRDMALRRRLATIPTLFCTAARTVHICLLLCTVGIALRGLGRHRVAVASVRGAGSWLLQYFNEFVDVVAGFAHIFNAAFVVAAQQ